MAIKVNWSLSPRVITIQEPTTDITIQELTNQIKDIEDEPAHLQYPILVLTFGKQSLGAGAQVGITAVLQNAVIAFAARSGPSEVLCTITAGNLVAVDTNGDTINPISPTAYTQVTIQQSTSPSIATPESNFALMYMLESLHGSHKSVGSVFYWDPTGGSDSNPGTTPTSAVASFTQAQSLCTAGKHDIIFALANDASGVTTFSTPITISKDTVKLRGPGYQFQLVPTSSGNDAVTITGNSVEFSGFYVKTAVGGSDDGVSIGSSVNNTIIKDCWIDSATANGIILNGSSRTKVQTCAIENSGAAGISITNSTILAKISNSIITGSTGNGVTLAGASTSDNIFEDNLIYNNGGYGISIGASVTRTGVRKHHTFSGNTSGDTLDSGTSTFIETAVGGASASAIADAVWDELIADHITAGTTGRTLKDAKSKATLASLK